MATVVFSGENYSAVTSVKTKTGEDLSSLLCRAVRKLYGKHAAILLDFDGDSGLIIGVENPRKVSIKITY